MASENEISEELKALGSMLAIISREMPFIVPQGYFEALEGDVMEGVRAAFNNETSKEMPFTVPQHYFRKNEEALLATAAIPNEDVAFKVPDGYFEMLPGKIMAAIHKEKVPTHKPTIIAFRPGLKVAQWAAAAMLILGLGISSYKIYYTPDRKASHQLAKVDAEAITQYVGQNIDANPTETVATNTPAAAAVKTLSNEEITSYLDETAWEDEAALN